MENPATNNTNKRGREYINFKVYRWRVKLKGKPYFIKTIPHYRDCFETLYFNSRTTFNVEIIFQDLMMNNIALEVVQSRSFVECEYVCGSSIASLFVVHVSLNQSEVRSFMKSTNYNGRSCSLASR